MTAPSSIPTPLDLSGDAPRALFSYVCGAWVRGAGKPTSLHHAVTGAVIAETGTGGIDFRAMVEHARTVGGPALRAMTFHQRARMLKALAQYLMAHKDAYYPVSAGTGATKRDGWVDIEGGIGTLFAYASRGRREFPDETFHVEGPTEPLSKGGTFVGRHICVPLEGVAVHINAFNFPVWGMLEKLAPTLLAGMPAIVKPATVTSFLTEAVFAGMIESGILPAGSVQLLCGGAEPFYNFLALSDWLYGRTHQTHAISRPRLRELLLEYLTEVLNHPAAAVDALTKHDALNSRRNSKEDGPQRQSRRNNQK